MFVWGVNITEEELLDSVLCEYLNSLPPSLPSVDWVWQEMDKVWNELRLSNARVLSSEQLSEFYGNPVWAMNGLFTMMDPVSANHRKSIAAYLVSFNCSAVADYGGGFGTLAQEIVLQNQRTNVSIVEPYPSPLSNHFLSRSKRIEFVSELSKSEHYDALISQDVLEHVQDPIGLAFDLVNSVCTGGLIIFANCFYPVIQCHLPHTFHLRHTFRYVMQASGLQFLGRVPGAEHAMAFRKTRKLNIKAGRCAERFSRIIGPVLNIGHPVFSKFKHLLLDQ